LGRLEQASNCVVRFGKSGFPADDNLAFDTVVKVADHGTIEFPKQLVAARIARSIAVARYRLPLGQPRDS
jgi:hypothetical protein